MNEYEIALNKVLPFLLEKLQWPKKLVSSYGRVPVQFGSTTRWADYVCYISENEKISPWLLIEVKRPTIPLEQALPQAESYSLILGAPFLCVTDGNDFDFFLTGNSQGKSIRIKTLPPIPAPTYLQTEIYVSFPRSVDYLVDLFILGLKEDEKFFTDTKWHDESGQKLHESVFQRLDFLTPEELKVAIDSFLMVKPPNKNSIFSQIDINFDRVKNSLRFISEFSGDPVINIGMLLDKNSDLYIKGGGIFFITQFLAGAHPDKYVVLEENVAKALQHLGITEVMVHNDTPNGYVYINEICIRLFIDKIQPKLKSNEFNFGLASVHNFLWHYYSCYINTKKWS